MLVVVGGSTGAGKSTLVNSLVGEEVSPAGVIRPTTRRPVLIHHPDDGHVFASSAYGDWDGLDPVVRAHSGLPAGLALLDAPDLDSIDDSNRAFAARLTAAADLWLFTTTAARYADAVPWNHVKQATSNGTTLAVVLDRVPGDSARPVRRHLSEMLVAEGLESTPLFLIPEVRRTAGLLPDDAMSGVKSWIEALGANPRARRLVARRTLRSAVQSVGSRVDEVAASEARQARALHELTAAVERELRTAGDAVATALTDGRLIRGEVSARWQDFIGTGQFFLGIESSLSRIRSRIGAALGGDRDAAAPLGDAIRGGQTDVIREGLADMHAALGRQWRRLPGGPGLLDDDGLQQPVTERQIGATLREWTGHVTNLVREEARGKRAKARLLSFGIDAVAVVVMLAVAAGSAEKAGSAGNVGSAGKTGKGAATGSEGAPTPTETAAIAERLLDSLFGDAARRELTDAARTNLWARTRDLFDSARKPFDEAVAALDVHADRADRLREAGRRFQENV
nr:dynamin family protein [Spelaeicoccus albus]